MATPRSTPSGDVPTPDAAPLPPRRSSIEEAIAAAIAASAPASAPTSGSINGQQQIPHPPSSSSQKPKAGGGGGVDNKKKRPLPNSNSTRTASSSMMKSSRTTTNGRRKTNNNNDDGNNTDSETGSAHGGGGGGRFASSATMKKTLRQTTREQRKLEDEAATAAASSALLDSVVPQQLIQSAARHVLSQSPRIFSFHTRHISSIRHPAFAFFCNESNSVGASSPTDPDGCEHSESGDYDRNSNADQQQQHGTTANKKGNNKHHATSAAAAGIHRGGTAMTTSAHVGAIDAALKAHRRPWQTLCEYLVDRFSDTSSAYPIEMERWRQTSYMFDSILLEDDVVRRRRDILDSVHVIRALEACWTSWGGTTRRGIGFDAYREQHIRLYKNILKLDALDPSFAHLVDSIVERDFFIDREVANITSSSSSPMTGSPARGNSNAASFRNDGGGLSSPRSASGSQQQSGRSSPQQSQQQGSFRVSETSAEAQQLGTNNNKPAVVYEVPFRKFCVSMLELADNWVKVYVGGLPPTQVFSQFLLSVVRYVPPRRTSPSSSNACCSALPASVQHCIAEAEKLKQQQQQNAADNNEDQGGEDVVSSAPLVPEGTSDFFDNGGQNRPTNRQGGDVALQEGGEGSGSSSRSSPFPTSPISGESRPSAGGGGGGGGAKSPTEWERVCAALRMRAYLHRGGPVIRLVPPQCPGVPPTYVAMGEPNKNRRGGGGGGGTEGMDSTAAGAAGGYDDARGFVLGGVGGSIEEELLSSVSTSVTSQ